MASGVALLGVAYFGLGSRCQLRALSFFQDPTYLYLYIYIYMYIYRAQNTP